MTEAYAFLAAFAVQILVISVLHAAWFARYARAKAEAQFPGWDGRSVARFLGLYRAVNAAIAVLGVVLLGWLYGHMRTPDWQLVPALRLLAFFTVVQVSPLVVGSVIGARIKKTALLRAPPQQRRTASLERRGLLDIVSPVTVFLALAGYVAFAVFMIQLRQHAASAYFGALLLLDVTLVYVLNGFAVYFLLYRRKRWPLETPAYRVQAVEVQVRIIFYVSIALVAFVSLVAVLIRWHLARWMPFAMSVYFVIVMLVTAMMLFTLRRQAEADRLNLSPAS